MNTVPDILGINPLKKQQQNKRIVQSILTQLNYMCMYTYMDIYD